MSLESRLIWYDKLLAAAREISREVVTFPADLNQNEYRPRESGASLTAAWCSLFGRRGMIEIVIESANEDTQRLNFEQESITIGRGLGNDIMLEDPQVSRYHARIVLQGDSLMLYDLRSRNGTRVNSERISSCAISITDAIYIGQAILRVRVDGEELPVDFNDGGIEKDADEHAERHLAESVDTSDENGFMETQIFTTDQVEVDLSENKKKTPRAKRATRESRAELLQVAHAGNSEDPWRPFENCLAPVLPYVRDESIVSITIHGHNRILVKSAAGVERVDCAMTDGQFQEALRIVSMSTKEHGSSQASRPLFLLTLADGTRISGCSPAVVPENGLLVIVPKHSAGISAEMLLQREVFNSETLFFLHGCVALRKTVLIAAPPSADSAGLLHVLADFIPGDQRICIFGEPNSIELPHEHVVHVAATDSAQFSIRRASLAELAAVTSPDRAVVSPPLTGQLCADFAEVASSACPGSLARIHAITPAAALAKLEIETHRAQPGLPAKAVRQQIYEAIDIIAQLAELPNGRQRVVRIAEVGSEGGLPELKDIFRLDRDQETSEEVIYRTPPSFMSDLRIAGFEEAYEAFRAA